MRWPLRFATCIASTRPPSGQAICRTGPARPAASPVGAPSASHANRMIAHLRGRLLEKHPNRVIVDVQGVGYEALVPLSTFYEMPEPGGDISLRIHTHVREDA